MKNVLLLSVLFILSSFALNTEKTSIQGLILNADGEGVVSAYVSLYSNDQLVAETMTTFGGAYEFKKIPQGLYTLTAQADEVGYKSINYRVNNLSGFCSMDLTLDPIDPTIKENPPHVDKNTIVISARKKPLISMDCVSTGSTISAEEIRSLPTRSVDGLASTSSGLKSTSSECAVVDKESRSDVTSYYIDGIRVSKISEEVGRSKKSKDSKSSKKKRKAEKAGQMTAGEWNDLHQWEAWNKLISDDEYKNMSNQWKVAPRERYSVIVTNAMHAPIPNAEVTLYSSEDEIIWESITDNFGKSELWNGVYNDEQEASYIEATFDGITKTLHSIQEIADGSNTITFDVECQKIQNLEVMFVVDATGSMGDEIQFLKSELKDVIHTVEASNEEVSIKTGSVFYRDKTDRYLSKVTNLSSDLSTTSSFIQEQHAGGGGDYPEAVEVGLQKALQQNWTLENTSRIIFLILDAPPHQNPEVIKTIQKQMQHAARLGIKIIPVTASGIRRPAEFLMKYMAILTNGTYVFITDHSGIGNAHLAPVNDDYEVEKLNDLMIRLLTQFSSSHSCDDQTIETIDFNVYPNPANAFITVDVKQATDVISIHSASGMIMMKYKDVKKGKKRIDLANLVAGMYTIRVKRGNQSKTKSFIKI